MNYLYRRDLLFLPPFLSPLLSALSFSLRHFLTRAGFILKYPQCVLKLELSAFSAILIIFFLSQIYWVGPLLGGMTAGFVYDHVFAANSSKQKFRTCMLGAEYQVK